MRKLCQEKEEQIEKKQIKNKYRGREEEYK
jgi:hypothetical protein